MGSRAGRPPGRRGRSERGPGRVERRRAAAREGLRPLHATPRWRWRRDPDRAAGATAPDAAVAAHAAVAPPGPRAGPAADGARVAADRAASRSTAAGARRRTRPRRLVLVCDVSGSMAPYARMLLQYMHACVAARRRVEAFAFGTRLTRITHELGGPRPRPGAGTRRGGGHRLLGRHPDRRGAGRAQPRPRPAARARRGRRDPVRRLGPRRSRGAGRRDGAAAPQRPPARVAQPAGRPPRLRAADARDARGVPHTDELLAGNSLASLEQLADILGGDLNMKDVLSEIEFGSHGGTGSRSRPWSP